MEDYTFSEQVSIFREAEMIVGPSGAAWANLIYSTSGTKALSWLPETMRNFSVYSTIAQYVGVEMEFILTKSKSKTNFHEAYEINTDLLKDKVISLLKNTA